MDLTDLHTAIERVVGAKKKRRSPVTKTLRAMMDRAATRAERSGMARKAELYDFRKERITFDFMGVMNMTENAAMLAESIVEQAEQANEQLKSLINESRATYSILGPELLEMVHKVRDCRMSVTTELQKTLRTMKDVRGFFLESAYQQEMDRLERFVALGERLKALIQDGTLDAVCDAALKLAIGADKG